MAVSMATLKHTSLNVRLQGDMRHLYHLLTRIAAECRRIASVLKLASVAEPAATTQEMRTDGGGRHFVHPKWPI